MSEATEDEDDAVLAAEFALGLLEIEVARRVEARCVQDIRFRALVAAWIERFARFADEITPVTPPASVQAKLEARLFGPPDPGRALGLWKALTGLAGLAAAVFAFLLFAPEEDALPAALFVSDIVAEDNSLAVLAVIDATAHTVRLTRTEGRPPPGRDFELWGIPSDGSPPVSIGVFPETPTATFQVPDALLGKATGLTLAISDEPTGGSPTGQPTGAVLALGAVSPL